MFVSYSSHPACRSFVRRGICLEVTSTEVSAALASDRVDTLQGSGEWPHEQDEICPSLCEA